MSTKTRKKDKDTGLGGFTIIEVVLVLAIAGLIFLMVFIALPALQRAQRDTQRRDDVAKVSEAVTQYQTNNNGRLPNFASGSDVVNSNNTLALPSCTSASTNSVACFIVNYLNPAGATEDEFIDPDGWTYGLKFYPNVAAFDGEHAGALEFNHMIYLISSAYCAGEGDPEPSSSSRDHAVIYKLEGSGVYCQDNR